MRRLSFQILEPRRTLAVTPTGAEMLLNDFAAGLPSVDADAEVERQVLGVGHGGVRVERLGAETRGARFKARALLLQGGLERVPLPHQRLHPLRMPQCQLDRAGRDLPHRRSRRKPSTFRR